MGLFVAFLLALQPVPALALDKPSASMDQLAAGASLWEATPDALDKVFAGGPRPQWLDAGRTSARFSGELMSLAGGKIPVVEASAEFAGGKLARVTFSLYNRGDAGTSNIAKKDFEEIMTRYAKTITELSGVQPVERRAAAGATGNAVKTKGMIWTGAGTAWLLESSTDTQGDKFAVEFVRLRLAPVGVGAGASASVVATRGDLSANVKREANGDVFLANVPMVDQGEKGYCVTATLERVLKYYGLTVDQHEMAQLAGSDAEGGTDHQSMMDALNEVKGKLHLNVKEIQPMGIKELTNLARDYNRVAKKAKKPLLSESEDAVANVQVFYAAMDAETLKQAKVGSADYARFQKTVRDFVEKGIPLIWDVELGKYEEPMITPQMKGGHMRMIIGCNEKTRELLFSDSWGAEHALKRMPMDNAFAMTQGLLVLEPRR